MIVAFVGDTDRWIAVLVDPGKREFPWTVGVDAGNVDAVINAMDGASTLDVPVRPCCTPPPPIVPPKEHAHIWARDPAVRDSTESLIEPCVSPRPEVR